MSQPQSAVPPPFGDWLKHARKRRDLTQDDLAIRIDCSLDTIRKLESGERRPSRQIADLLAEVFAIPADERVAFVHFARVAPGNLRSATASETGPLAPAPWRIHHRHQSNLPVPPTALVGREQQVDMARGQLLGPRTRLLTLLGPPGVGKTRLALAVATAVIEYFDDGVFFVELAPIRDTDLVLATIGRALDLKVLGTKSLLDALKEYLAARRVLLVLDNFEQVVEAAGEIAQLLAACPWLRVLVTSRVPLAIRGERQFAVPPLAVPDLARLPSVAGVDAIGNYAAVQLFRERAQDVDAGFELAESNVAAVATICVRLDGLPLALELAAARVKLFPPAVLLGRLADRLQLLTGGGRDRAARLQTLRGAIDWSYDLLAAGEQQLFTRLAVFQGGWTLGALEAVCNFDGGLALDLVGAVQSLLEQSLLQQQMGRAEEPRFGMLETIHEYAREKLGARGEATTLAATHLAYFLALAEQAEPELAGAQQQNWLDRLETEHDNLRAALAWAQEPAAGDAAAVQGLRLASALGRFWELRGYLSEGRAQLMRVLAASPLAGAALPDALQTHRARALSGAGMLAYRIGDYPVARSLHEASLALRRALGDTWGVATALSDLGLIAGLEGKYALADALQSESLRLRRELGDRQGIATSVGNLGVQAFKRGDYPLAQTLLEECLALRRELGNTWGIAWSLNNLGIVAFLQGDCMAAWALYEESLALRRALGDKRGIALVLNNLGNVANQQGNYPAAGMLQAESLVLRQEMGDKLGIAESLGALGSLAALCGQARKGAQLLSASAALLTAMGAAREPDDAIPYEKGLAAARTRLSDAAFAQAWQEGEGLPLEAAIALALEEPGA